MLRVGTSCKNAEENWVQHWVMAFREKLLVLSDKGKLKFELKQGSNMVLNQKYHFLPMMLEIEV
jgi:hypothetical protein